MENNQHEHAYCGLRLQDMSVPESLLVVSLRLWFLERTCPPDTVLPDWRGGLCAIGFQHLADDVVVPLFECLFSNRQGIEVLPLYCTRISREERSLLTCVILMQQQRHGELKQLLAGYTFPATARVVLALLARFGSALEEAGMVLPLRTAMPAAVPQNRTVSVRVH